MLGAGWLYFELGLEQRLAGVLSSLCYSTILYQEQLISSKNGHTVEKLGARIV